MKKQIVKFLLVGILNTIFGYTMFSFLIYIGLHYSIAVLIGTVLGVLFNFKTTGRYVFNNSDNTLIMHFFAVYVVIYFLNISGLWLLQEIGLKNIYVAGAIMIVPSATVSFLLNKLFVFKKKTVLHN